jgi:ribosome-binding protein aMBF1 (putative translation factor)
MSSLKKRLKATNDCDAGSSPNCEIFRVWASYLVAARIAQGISQRELAERLSVHESQISRDERNEYHGVTVERAQKVLEALKIEIRTSVEMVGGEVHATN